MTIEKKLYIAYGSNMNKAQMKMRCPGAKYIGMAELTGYELTYRGHNHRGGVANIEPKKGGKVPVVVWTITPKDEAALDHYEGCSWLYTKETIKAIGANGKEYVGLVYIMTDGWEIADPTYDYVWTIMQGYMDGGLDPNDLANTVRENRKKMQK